MPHAFEQGLTEIGDGCFAYLQPDGGWGWSNAGLVVGDGQSMLVDTLFDLRLTQAMLDAMAVHTASAPIATLVNTHANGDHCYGNELVPHAEIVASVAAAHEMTETPPAMLAALNRAPGELGDLFRSFFGQFDFEGISLTPPTRTFTGYLDVEVGGKPLQLIEVGPAHTSGDVLVYSPSDRTVFTGDIVFNGGSPIAWVGPLTNWIAACDLLLGLDVETVVPGHGPITNLDGVATFRDELDFINREATGRFEAGVDAWSAAQEIAQIARRQLGEPGRVAVNVETVYRTLDPTHKSPDVVELFRRMHQLGG